MLYRFCTREIVVQLFLQRFNGGADLFGKAWIPATQAVRYVIPHVG